MLSGVCERCRSAPERQRPTTGTHAGTPRMAIMVFVLVRCRVCAPRPRCVQGTQPIASCRPCEAQRKNTIDQGLRKHGNPRRARHPSVVTAGVCSSSVPADLRATFAGRVYRRDRAGTKDNPSRHRPQSQAGIMPRTPPKLFFVELVPDDVPRCGTSSLRPRGSWPGARPCGACGVTGRAG